MKKVGKVSSEKIICI